MIQARSMLLSLGCLLLCLVALVQTLGCTARIGDFTAISSKNIAAKGVNIAALPKERQVEGRSVKFLGIGATIEEALDEALEKANGNLMTDCALYLWNAPFVSGFLVKGDVVSVPYAKTSD